MQVNEYNCETGETTLRNMTPEEEASMQGLVNPFVARQEAISKARSALDKAGLSDVASVIFGE